MRTFWIIIGLIAVLAAIVFWRDDSNSSGLSVPEPALNADVQPPVTGGPATIRGNPAAAGPSPDALSQNAVAPSSAGLRLPASQQSNEYSDEQALADELLDSAELGAEDDLADELGADMPDATGEAAKTELDGPVVDGTYVVAGEGTSEQPYDITWDLLMLSSQTYQPRLGKTEFPARVKAVDGQRIRISGYYTIPIASTDAREVLFMLNMWDGCCIGLPPSPYDAIEVRLKEPLSGDKQFVNFGTLSGTLKVDPYVQNGWLLGLYLMEDGELEVGM